MYLLGERKTIGENLSGTIILVNSVSSTKLFHDFSLTGKKKLQDELEAQGR
jgi:hypothetical protein